MHTPQDLRQFAALQAVAAAGSISGGAAALQWSDATVQYHLANLEKTVGDKLLTRSRRGTTLTPAGEALLGDAKHALSSAAHAVEAAQARAQGAQAELRIGVFPSAAAQLLPRISRRLRTAEFELRATLAETGVLDQMLRQGELDAAISYTTPQQEIAVPDAIVHTRVLHEKVLLAVPAAHRLARSDRVTLEQLLDTAQESWILGATTPDAVDQLVQRVFQEHGAEPNIKIRTDDYTVALGMVSSGLAVTVVPELGARAATPGVALREVADPRFYREIMLLTPPLAGTAQSTGQHLQELQEAVTAAAAEFLREGAAYAVSSTTSSGLPTKKASTTAMVNTATPTR